MKSERNPTPTHLPSFQDLNLREKTWHYDIVWPKSNKQNKLKTNPKDKQGSKISLFILKIQTSVWKEVESLFVMILFYNFQAVMLFHLSH